MDRRAFGRDPHLADHGAVLLRESRKIEHGRDAAVDMRRHAEQRADSQHAKPANPRDIDIIGPIEPREHWRRKPRKAFALDRGDARRIGSAQHRALDFDEAGAKALEARKILVARRLVDPALHAVGSRQRLHRDAVRLHRTIAAAFANARIDEQAAIRIGIGAALAPPSLFRGAGLFIDDGGDTGRVA